MKNKILLAIVFTMIMSVCAFAQVKYEHLGLSDSDVKNFAKNYNAIVMALKKYEVDPSSVLNPEKAGEKMYNELISLLNKNGVSGEKAITKVQVICFYAGIAAAVKEMEKNPETAAQMKAMGIDPLLPYRDMYDEADYQIVLKNFQILNEALNLEE